jgi:beta-galactosidase
MLKYSMSIAVLISLSISCLTGCQGTSTSRGEQVISLNGSWQFTADRKNEGMDANWFGQKYNRSSWQQVEVPHTWQVMPGLEEYTGYAWYARTIKLDCPVQDKVLKLEFDSVNRDASFWVNGKLLGEHKGSGYTPFGFVVPAADAQNGNMRIVVRVTNSFSRRALPYERSYDWTTDGGIIRGVRLRILPRTHIERLLVDANPSADFTQAKVSVRVDAYSAENKVDGLSLQAIILDPSNNIVRNISAPFKKDSNGKLTAELSCSVEKPMLWHFDKPHLYRAICRITSGRGVIHEQEASFGIRKVEVKNGFYVLNGEPMRLMGLEWMPGSDPRYGLAEGPEYVAEILSDMKRLNCVLTRFHWQQDDSTLEFLDREGMLAQEEIPTWGGATRLEQLGDIQLIQMNEMILPHYNHPSIYAWGLCNEIAGQSAAGHKFVMDGIAIAKKLNPQRLLTYASNTVHQNPKKDASQYVDFIEWNEYFESWMGGNVSNLAWNIDAITKAYPDKTMVISEYGLCECDPKNPTGDAKRIEILRTHTDEFRKTKSIAGAIFFCYNDYRTHMGDKDKGAFRQRVHGIVDLLNRPKPSWQALREESSPIKSITITAQEPNNFNIDILTRSLKNDLPAYTLRDYVLIWRALDSHNLPIQSGHKTISELKPGTNFKESIKVSGRTVTQIKAEVFRPTGYSVLDAQWSAPSEPKPN